MNQERSDTRRYRILGVIGKGGFGTVYRARLEGPQGFTKDVAIKLANKEDVPESILQRFRDEARILGLVRDRAIVGVDPPTRLDGRWAVVMEYVDGISAGKLIAATPFPPTVALELVQECARALEKVYRQPGPDGRPLEVLHRDLKPGNIQLSPSGEVKLLDFGIARAAFTRRESTTTDHIGGTPGYIAPERVYGIESQAGDVYSLGVVLHVLLTGEKPTEHGYMRRWHNVERTPDVLEALYLAARMHHEIPEDRPTLREVTNKCNKLRKTLDGPELREWAEKTVPEALKLEDDDLVGAVLTETLASVPIAGNLPNERETTDMGQVRRSPVLLVMAVAIPVLIVAVLSMAGAMTAIWGQMQDLVAATSAETKAQQAELQRLRTQLTERGKRPQPSVATVAEPDSEEDEAAKAKTKSKSEETAPAPRPRARRTAVVSQRGDAEGVWLVKNDQRIPIASNTPVPVGEYEVRAVFKSKEVTAGRVSIEPGAPVMIQCAAFVRQCRVKK